MDDLPDSDNWQAELWAVESDLSLAEAMPFSIWSLVSNRQSKSLSQKQMLIFVAELPPARRDDLSEPQ